MSEATKKKSKERQMRGRRPLKARDLVKFGWAGLSGGLSNSAFIWTLWFWVSIPKAGHGSGAWPPGWDWGMGSLYTCCHHPSVSASEWWHLSTCPNSVHFPDQIKWKGYHIFRYADLRVSFLGLFAQVFWAGYHSPSPTPSLDFMAPIPITPHIYKDSLCFLFFLLSHL